MSEVNAWGRIVLNIGDFLQDLSKPVLQFLGIVEEDSFVFEIEEGEKIELYRIGHVLVDTKQLENIESLTCTLVVPTFEQILNFWNVSATGWYEDENYQLAGKDGILFRGSDDVQFSLPGKKFIHDGGYKVHSTVSNKFYYVQFLPERIGAIMFEVFKARASCILSFAEKKGWLLTIKFTFIPIKRNGKLEKFKLFKRVI